MTHLLDSSAGVPVMVLVGRTLAGKTKLAQEILKMTTGVCTAIDDNVRSSSNHNEHHRGDAGCQRAIDVLNRTEPDNE